MVFSPGAETDERLLARVGDGDERALAELYARYGSAVFAFVLVRTSDRGAAEEVSADVWVGCWRSARAFRGDSQVLTWLLGIAKRQVWTHARGKRLATVPLDDQAETVAADTEDPADVISASDAVGSVLDALGALPPELAEVVRLAWLHEMPYGQIAVVVGVPVGTVKSRVARARRMLRGQLRRQDV